MSVNVENKIEIRYINLDRSVTRRSNIENRLRQLGLDSISSRFSAVEPKSPLLSRVRAGQAGCLLSHKEVIAGMGDRVLAVFEDDAIIQESFLRFICERLDQVKQFDWDIIFLAHTYNYLELERVRYLLSFKSKLRNGGNTGYQLLDCAQWYKWGTVSYLVNPNAKHKFERIFHKSEYEGFPHPVDEVYGESFKRGGLKGYILFPSIVGVDIDLGGVSEVTGSALNHETVRHLILANLFVDGVELDYLGKIVDSLGWTVDRGSPEWMVTKVLESYLAS